MLWEAGGDILNADNTQAAFNSPAGVRAATMLQEMQQDGSLYLDYHPDSGQYGNLFNSGKIGMLITGPWYLSGLVYVKTGTLSTAIASADVQSQQIHGHRNDASVC